MCGDNKEKQTGQRLHHAAYGVSCSHTRERNVGVPYDQALTLQCWYASNEGSGVYH